MARTKNKDGAGVSAGLVVALCFAVTIPEGFDLQAIGVAAPKLVPALHLNHSQAGWAVSASLFGLVVGAMIGGWLADRIGRKPVMIGSVVAFGLFSLATVRAFDFQSLFWLRFATGLGLGGALPNVIAMPREISTPKSRALTSSMMFAALPIGGAVAALYAHGVDKTFAFTSGGKTSAFDIHFGAADWQSIFVLGGVIPLVLAVLVWLLLPETRSLAIGDDPEEILDRRTLAGLFGGGRAGATLALWLAFVLTNIVVYLLLN